MRARPTATVARIAVALALAWATLVAIPGGVPWAATDASARAIAFGIVIASVVALAGAVAAWMRADDLGDAGASIGTAAGLAALGLVALEVVNLMVLPADAPYRLLVTGVGLLVLVAIALAAVAAVRSPTFGARSMRIPWLGVIGAAIGVVVAVAYLLLTQTMVTVAGSADDAEWSRLTTLLGGFQTIVFAALGALLGTIVQARANAGMREELSRADEALSVFEADAREIVHELRTQVSDAQRATDAALGEALAQDPARFRSDAARSRWVRSNRPESAESLGGLADSLEQIVASARRIRSG